VILARRRRQGADQRQDKTALRSSRNTPTRRSSGWSATAPLDPDGKLDVRNVGNQIGWLQEQGSVDKGLDVDAIIAKDYVKPD
jgi:hypothetical protein